MSSPNSSSSSASSKNPSTFDLLRWSDSPLPSPSPSPVRFSATNDSSAFMSTAFVPDSTPSRPVIRTHQPAGGISSIMLGANLSLEEAEALNKRKPNSELKKRVMSGSGIFSQNVDLESNSSLSAERPMVRVHQPAGGVSQISFGVDGAVSPKKPTSIPEVAKQRELSGTLEAEETSSRKNASTSKVKELVGSNIFGPPPDLPPRSLGREYSDSVGATTPTPDASLKPSKNPGGSNLSTFGQEEQDLSARKSNNQKAAELSGNSIFKDHAPSALPEKSLSAAKRREISGNDIFADEKPVIRDHLGGIRKPPGGESSLTLV